MESSVLTLIPHRLPKFSTPHPLLSPTLPLTKPINYRVYRRYHRGIRRPRVLPCLFSGFGFGPLASGDDAGSWWGKVLSTLPVNFSLCYTIVIHKQGTIFYCLHSASATDDLQEQQSCLSLTSSPSPTSTLRASASSFVYDDTQTLPLPHTQH